MALSNSERQARFRQRLKDRARQGVTPDMIVKAVRLAWEAAARDDPSLGSWEEALDSYRGKRGRGDWLFNLPRAQHYDDFREFGEDAELMRSAVAVIEAVLTPPAI